MELLFDTLRSPYDMAHIVQVAQATDAIVYTSGANSLSFNNKKVRNKIESWHIKPGFQEIHYDTFYAAANDLRSKGKYLVGTSATAANNFYDVKLPENQDIVIIFGTETSGLTIEKQKMLDEMVRLPMDTSKVNFLTLPTVVSAMSYELYRRFL